MERVKAWVGEAAKGRGTSLRNVLESKAHSLSPEMIQKSKVKRVAGQGRGSVAARYESDTHKKRT